MNYLKRYQNGEYQRVWDELQALGPDVRKESHYPQPIEVAAETMRRVRLNCELIVGRLKSAGYIFGFYPDAPSTTTLNHSLVHPGSHGPPSPNSSKRSVRFRFHLLPSGSRLAQSI